MNKIGILGLGQTGFSVARYYQRCAVSFCVFDSRIKPPLLNEFIKDFPDAELFLGDFSISLFKQCSQLIISPGIDPRHSAIQQAKASGIEVIGDVALFARETIKPVIAITGSNGKSTVTAMVASILNAAGIKAVKAGNIGQPVLDILDTEYEVAVLELSSFQLETIRSLSPKVAVNLNVCADHLDRYSNYEEYVAIKKSIYKHADVAVIHCQQQAAWQGVSLPATVIAVDRNHSAPEASDYQRLTEADLRLSIEDYYDYQIDNMLIAMACVLPFGVKPEAASKTLVQFPGLAHRCQDVATINGVRWINDSKATNVGSAKAAIESVGRVIAGKVVLIAGGDGKAADFSDLTAVFQDYTKQVIVIGKDAYRVEKCVPGSVHSTRAKDLPDAVRIAMDSAQTGDAVLLSPACSSLDMFKDYRARGECFIQEVKQLVDA